MTALALTTRSIQTDTTAIPAVAGDRGSAVRDDSEFRALAHPIKAEAMQRAQCVAAFRHAKARARMFKAALPGLIVDLRGRYTALKISRTSLYRWNDAAGDPIDPMELVDPRKLTRSVPAGSDGSGISPEAADYFREIYLESRAPSLRICHQRALEFAQRHGYTWCATYHQARRLKPKLIDRQTEMQHRDPDRYRSTCRPWIERDPESFAANECWVSDHRPLDVICYVEDEDAPDGRRHFRPYATVWIDWRSRTVLGHELVETPNTASILAAFKDALLNPLCAGPPRFAWIDNGRDFDSYTLQGVTKAKRRQLQGELKIEGEQTLFPGVFGLLHIEPHHAIPYEGQGKARCERIFATMGSQFDVTFASYTGKDTTRKPDDLAMHIKAGHAPHFLDVKARFNDWIIGYNSTTEHSVADLDSMSRVQAYTAWSTPAVMPDRQTIEMVCYQWPAPPSRKDGRQLGRKVGRNGVSVMIGGATVRYGWNDDALRAFKGTDRQVVVCYDPADINQLYVFDEHMSLVTVARRNTVVGRYTDPLTAEQLKAASRSKAAYERAGKVTRKHREFEYLSTEEIAAKKARRSRPVRIEPEPGGNTRLVQTRIDQAAQVVQRRKLKAAVGSTEPSPGFVYTPLSGGCDEADDSPAAFSYEGFMGGIPGDTSE